ncbi:ArpU family transcriptional regulator [Neobacillus sp. OS1-2]|uniref:ArpU family transcriptional regulator n=1 Tax=Neobacillus sp. OS1-2 TaxID=3070680 RepID=UPI0027E1B43D|nr:ArpU family transcriptional regulator [Neobacillus sp. OS1-2]WML38692.1 ArpU family transcriptional regulator [Neobacillus sp. OS1-2]
MSVVILIGDKEIQETVIKDLKDYKALKVKFENIKERQAVGANNLFTPLTKTETFDELKARQIERALTQSLDPIERKIIEIKYLNTHQQELTDLEIYLSLGLYKGKYYSKKREAIRQLAKALGYI